MMRWAFCPLRRVSVPILFFLVWVSRYIVRFSLFFLALLQSVSKPLHTNPFPAVNRSGPSIHLCPGQARPDPLEKAYRRLYVTEWREDDILVVGCCVFPLRVK